MNYKLNFDTEYNQFYICDKESTKNTNDSTFWSQIAHTDRLAIGQGILGIGIQSYGHVKGELTILDTADNNEDYARYDHIVEGGLRISSGVIQVLNCPNSNIELEINIKPGIYRVRIYSSGFATTDIDEEEGDDYYRIKIWPDSNIERKVLKQNKL